MATQGLRKKSQTLEICSSLVPFWGKYAWLNDAKKTKALYDHNSYPPSSGTSHVWHCSDGDPKLQLSVDQQLAPAVGSLEIRTPAARASHNDLLVRWVRPTANINIWLYVWLHIYFFSWHDADVNHMVNFGAPVLSHMVDDLMGFAVRILGFPQWPTS